MRFSSLVLLGILLSFGIVQAQTDIPAAPIVNDEGGPVTITGTLTYTDPLFTTGVSEPEIILEDQAGFVDRNRYFLMPVESQVIGQLTSDFYTSPVSYSLSLPEVPHGSYRDVNHDGKTDQGVQVFAIAYWENIFGDPYLQQRDLYGGGWSGAYASTRISDDPSQKWEVTGGEYVVYAPDDQQDFPDGFGADGKLFTADDPLVRLPAGYTVVNMDTTPFTFDRSRNPVIDLIEPQSAALVDYSKLSFTKAFDAMIEKLRHEYAFTDYKHIDWDALKAEFRPRFQSADQNNDVYGYLNALRDFTWSIPDGHVGWAIQSYLSDEFHQQTDGGLGMAIRELDDGRVIVNYILPNGPADSAGIQLRAVVTAINGQPIEDALSQVVPWSGPFSSEHVRKLEQLRYIMRSPVGTDVEITYQNPDASDSTTVTLTSVNEQDSFQFAAPSGIENATGFEQPLDYKLLPSGYAYAKIYSFFDNSRLSVELWERLMTTLNKQGTPGLIIDMRENYGGSGFLADQMAAYLFEDPLVLGNSGIYDKTTGQFYFNSRGEDRFYLPPKQFRYDGKVAVLVGPTCDSACEFFSYDTTLQNRAAIVGEYPTAGMGGGIDYFILPGGIFFQFTAARAVDANGNIHIEGKGVQPTVKVPVNEDTLFSQGDPVLDAAINYLDSAQ